MLSRRTQRRPGLGAVVLSASLLTFPLSGETAGPGDQADAADRDFATAMIAHHRAEIELAQAVMQHGTDPEIRKLAQVVNATHRRQLAFLKAWLLDNSGREGQAYPHDRHDP